MKRRQKNVKNSQSITKQKLLLVEGQDEVKLFSPLLPNLGLSDEIQIVNVGGKSKLQKNLEAQKWRTGFHRVTSIGIIQDADKYPERAFQSVCDALKNADMPQPSEPLQPTGDKVRVTILIVPDIDRGGMIEDVCLESVEDDPAMGCVEQYFQCLENRQDELPQNIVKAKVHAFLASREWLEITYFESLQRCIEEDMRKASSSSSISVAEVHTFLASRYTPNLRLGEAAKKGYWDFDHQAFDKIKQFLQML